VIDRISVKKYGKNVLFYNVVMFDMSHGLWLLQVMHTYNMWCAYVIVCKSPKGLKLVCNMKYGQMHLM